MSKAFFSYDKIHSLVQTNLHITKGKEIIVGISRGGLIPAVIFSHHSGLPLATVTWQTRDGQITDTSVLANIIDNYRNILFVDDINDTGETFKQISEYVKFYSKYIDKSIEVSYHSVLRKTETSFLDATCAEELDASIWVVFPWEKNDGI